MGFFSWECAKTGKPILADMGKEDPFSFASEVVVLFDNGDKCAGTYNGYGIVHVGDRVPIDLVETTGWKMVIKRYYKDEAYSELPQNTPEPRQGYFWDEAELFSIFS